jgi:hypothetical protein
MAVTLPWKHWDTGHPFTDAFEQIDEALALLEAGLPL